MRRMIGKIMRRISFSHAVSRDYFLMLVKRIASLLV